MERIVHLKTFICIACMLVFFSNYSVCRKSDYKLIKLSKFIQNEIEDFFHEELEKTNLKNRRSKAVKRLYEKYSNELKDYVLHRLQPSKTVGSKHNITLEGNRKQYLTIETLSKGRPLIFQIDNFLFDDECEHLIKRAKERGLRESYVGDPELEGMGVVSSVYNDFGKIEFDMLDRDGDSYINATELHRLFRDKFSNKMGMVLVYEIMRKTYMDFDLDGKIAEWEWNSKNVTSLVKMLNASQSQNPVSQPRYSNQAWIDHSYVNDNVIKSIQDRLHKLTGLPLPMMRNSEPLQVVHYVPGGHYDCHIDSQTHHYPDKFKPCCHQALHTDGEEDDVTCHPCRYMTALYYLGDPDSGGETAFPVVGVDPKTLPDLRITDSNPEDWCDLSVHCQMAKVRVKPKKGRLVLWYNHFIHPGTNWTGPVDQNSLHGGCAVHKGTKWIANSWINAGLDKEHDILSWAMNEINARIGQMILKKRREAKKSEEIKSKISKGSWNF